MKISELCQRAGVSLATAKYYLREGLLPPGVARGVNQADYGEAHLRRLAVIRQLREVGGLSLEAIGRVTQLLDVPDADVCDVLGEALDALDEPPAEAFPREADDVAALLASLGWTVRPSSVPLQRLAASLHVVRARHGAELPIEALLPYAQVAHELAALEVGYIADELRSDPSTALESAVLGTVLWEPILSNLRRLAHESVTRELVGEGAAPEV